FLACGYLIVAATTALTTGLGVYAACVCPNLRSAVLRAYGLTAVFVCGLFIPPGGLFSPFAVLIFLHEESGVRTLPLVLTVLYAGLQFVISGSLLAASARSLRNEDQAPPLKSGFPLPPNPAGPVTRSPARTFELPR